MARGSNLAPGSPVLYLLPRNMRHFRTPAFLCSYALRYHTWSTTHTISNAYFRIPFLWYLVTQTIEFLVGQTLIHHNHGFSIIQTLLHRRLWVPKGQLVVQKQWAPLLDPHLQIVPDESSDISFYITISIKGPHMKKLYFNDFQESCFIARMNYIE